MKSTNCDFWHWGKVVGQGVVIALRVSAWDEHDETELLGDGDASCVRRHVPEISEPMLDWMGQGETPAELPAATRRQIATAMKTLFIILY